MRWLVPSGWATARASNSIPTDESPENLLLGSQAEYGAVQRETSNESPAQPMTWTPPSRLVNALHEGSSSERAPASLASLRAPRTRREPLRAQGPRKTFPSGSPRPNTYPDVCPKCAFDGRRRPGTPRNAGKRRRRGRRLLADLYMSLPARTNGSRWHMVSLRHERGRVSKLAGTGTAPGSEGPRVPRDEADLERIGRIYAAGTDGDLWMDTRSVELYLNISRRTFYRLVERGAIPREQGGPTHPHEQARPGRRDSGGAGVVSAMAASEGRGEPAHGLRDQKLACGQAALPPAGRHAKNGGEPQ